MDDRLFKQLGKLYIQASIYEEEISRLRLELQQKNEELAFLKEKDGHGTQGVSDK